MKDSCDNCKHLQDGICQKGRDPDEYDNYCELFEKEVRR